MEKQKKQQTIQKMLEIEQLIEQGNSEKTTKVEDIIYLKQFVFSGSNLAEQNLFVAKIRNPEEETYTYEIYSGNTNTLIATVNEQGKVQFRPEYLESLKQLDERYFSMLQLENLKFNLPQELEKEDIILTREERSQMQTNQEQSQKKKALNSKAKEGKDSQDEKSRKNMSLEEMQKENIAKKKKISTNSVLMIKPNSNFYKDHPNLEPNLYFYRDQNGVVKAEFIDKDGISKPSKYFEDSNTSLRQETIRLGDNGKPVERQVPYQVMKTKGLNSVDQDIRDIRISIHIDAYGYLEIEEARQGREGEWLSHNIEVKGRRENSAKINQETSIKTREANPDEQIKSYKQAENTGLKKDGIEYDEMYLVEHAEEVVDQFVKEGYQKREAVQIFNYMIGEEALTEQEAKQKVNEEIERENSKEERRNEKNSKANVKQEEVDQGEERTPWGDAMRRSRKF